MIDNDMGHLQGQDADRPVGAKPAFGDMPLDVFRASGHELLDWAAGYLERVETLPVTARTQPGRLRAELPTHAPLVGEPIEAILGDIDRLILPAMTHWNHPSFHGYFNSSASSPGILGELLAATLNPNCMLWQSCPAGTELEEVMVNWLREAVDLPEGFSGVMYDSASTSTLHGIAAARHYIAPSVRELGLGGLAEPKRLRLYGSEQVHSSVEKAAMTLGLGLEGVRKIAMDDRYGMRSDKLIEAIVDDRRTGWLPFCVVGVVGTTSTTAIDPIGELADICETEQLWLHVDAAHAGAAALVPELRWVLDGCERADSVVINPHKWMFVPMDLSVLLTRRMETLRNCFSLVPEYLRTAEDDNVVNYMDYGVPLGRRFRALKLWFVMRYFGVKGIVGRIREHVRLARMYAEFVEKDPRFERLAPVPLSTVCFRAAPKSLNADALDELNRRLLNAVNATGRAFLSHTKLDDRFVLRFVVSHLRTTERHVRGAWQLIGDTLDHVLADGVVPS